MASRAMEKVKVEPENTETVAEVKPKKKKFEAAEMIACRSVTDGVLNMEGVKSKNLYSWREYGDIENVEYADLVAEVRGKSSFLFNPWIIVENEDFVNEQTQLKKFYTESYTVKELRDVLSLPVKDMVVTINALPSSAVNNLKSLAASAVSNGTLDSVKKIKALDEIFGTDLNLLASLFDK